MNRRRMLLNLNNSGSKVTIPEGYITDGLVFMLDGIEKNVSGNRWKDLVKRLLFSFTGPGTLTSTDNSMHFNNCALMSTKSPNKYDLSLITVEFVFSGSYAKNTVFPLFSFNGNNKDLVVTYYCTRNSIIFCSHLTPNIGGTSTSGSYWASQKQTSEEKKTVSISGQLGIINGTTMNTAIGNYSGSDNYGVNYIGGRKDQTSNPHTPAPMYYFSGDIYSIRIYNRILTAEEVLSNQITDNERFNLGLIINNNIEQS